MKREIEVKRELKEGRQREWGGTLKFRIQIETDIPEIRNN